VQRRRLVVAGEGDEGGGGGGWEGVSYFNLEELVRVASPTWINLEEPGQGGQPT
jgi:hypothetical protein